MIPQRWQIHLTAIYGSREEDQGAPRRGGVRLPFRLIAAAIPLISQLMTGVTFTSIRLVTASDHSVLQPLRLVRLPMWRLDAVSNQPVLQPDPRSAIKCCGLATVSNNGVPASATQAGRMPSRCESPQALIPVPTTVFRAILPRRRAVACPLRARSARRCPCGRAPSRTRGSANAA